MTNILVYYLYSPNNAGDMAICLGLLDLLEEIPNISVTMVSRFSKKEKEYSDSLEIIKKYHPNVKVRPGYISFSRDSNLLKRIFGYISGAVLSIFPFLSKRLKQDISNNDMVILNGGNFLRCNSFADLLRLKAMFIPLIYAKKQRKRLVCMPQSSNNSSKRKYENNLRKYVSMFDFVFTRESKTYNYFKDNNIISVNKISNASDLAFFTKNRFKRNENLRGNFDKCIACNIRTTGIGDIGSIGTEKANEIFSFYEKCFLKYPNYKFLLICQTLKDKPGMLNFYKNMKLKNITNIDFIEEHDAYLLKNIYSNVDLVISSRLHASILAISSYKNVIGYTFEEWGFKNKGVLFQFSMSNFSNGKEIINLLNEPKIFEKNDSLIKNVIDFNKHIISEKFSELIDTLS